MQIYMLQQLPVSHKRVAQQGHKTGQKIVVIVVSLVEKNIFLCSSWLRH